MRVLRYARVRLLAWVPVLLAANFLCRAARFWAVLGVVRPRADSSSGRLRFRDAFFAVLLSQGANNVLPFRAGEVVRTREIVERGYGVSGVAAAQLTEKLVELVTLLVTTAPVVLSALRHVLHLAIPLTALGMLLVVWGIRRLHRVGPPPASDRTPPPVSQRRSIVVASFWSFATVVTELALIAVCLRGLDLEARLYTVVAVFAAVNVAISIPATPGHVGALEAGATLALLSVGVPRVPAIAFALLYRVVQWIPVTAVAGVVWAARSFSTIGPVVRRR